MFMVLTLIHGVCARAYIEVRSVKCEVEKAA
jgi:hypothetical protein